MRGVLFSVLAGAFLLSVMVFFSFYSPKENMGIAPQITSQAETTTPARSGTTGRLTLKNAFLPGAGGGLSAQSPPDLSAEDAAPGTAQSFIEKLGSALRAVGETENIPRQDLLNLPAVKDNELAIDSSGIGDANEYTAYFISHWSDISFDYSRFNQIEKDNDGAIVFSMQLVEQVLRGDDLPKADSSLLVWRDFLEAEIAFLRTIKVAGKAAVISKNAIALNKLNLELIDKARAVTAGTLPQKDLLSFYERYQRTIVFYHQKLVEETYLAALGKKNKFLADLVEFFGLARVVRAAIPVPFGGPIVFAAPCTCPPFGLNVGIGPPSPATLYYTTPFMASPLFFPFKSVRQGAYQLGLYVTVPLPCHFPPLCTVSFPIATMVGTST